jgi:2-polyprenyl-6-methoxyphenol hydroxylase-like FAD-dependent oxidoreductase
MPGILTPGYDNLHHDHGRYDHGRATVGTVTGQEENRVEETVTGHRKDKALAPGTVELTVAIVGAGLSGLICARILQRDNIPVTVYEADESEEARQQGGSLDIHTGTGQAALREAGLYQAFIEHTHVGGEAVRVLDKRAHVFVDQAETAGGNGRPEIDRKVLRKLLVDSLDPGTVVWGRRVVAARPHGTGHRLEFADGATVRADLVVGADGAWSKVRALVTAVRPAYTGITVVEIRLSDAATRHPEALAIGRRLREGDVPARGEIRPRLGPGPDHHVHRRLALEAGRLLSRNDPAVPPRATVLVRRPG